MTSTLFVLVCLNRFVLFCFASFWFLILKLCCDRHWMAPAEVFALKQSLSKHFFTLEDHIFCYSTYCDISGFRYTIRGAILISNISKDLQVL